MKPWEALKFVLKNQRVRINVKCQRDGVIAPTALYWQRPEVREMLIKEKLLGLICV